MQQLIAIVFMRFSEPGKPASGSETADMAANALFRGVEAVFTNLKRL
jgi:hypothetical protein